MYKVKPYCRVLQKIISKNQPKSLVSTIPPPRRCWAKLIKKVTGTMASHLLYIIRYYRLLDLPEFAEVLSCLRKTESPLE